MPMNTWEFARVELDYLDFPGWEGDLRSCRKWSDLPNTAQQYLTAVEDETKTPIAIVSVGPDRDETIIVRPELIWG